MVLRFICALLDITISFYILLSSVLFYGNNTFDGLLDSLHYRVILNKTAMDIYMQVFC